MNYKKGLERNLWLFAFLRVFHKRTYLAVIVVYATSYAGLTVEQFGIVAAITAIVTLILEVPSGYLSDKMGHKSALIFGAVFIAVAPLFFVFSPNFYGVLFASLTFFSGSAFHSGTVQALLHETLIELDRSSDYGDVAARAQRWGLFGNIFLVALVPMTYQIDPRAPFLVGFILQSFVFVISASFTSPRGTKRKISEKVHDGFFALLREVRVRGEIFLFLFLGIIAGMHNHIPGFKELYFQEIGVPVWFFGFVYSLMGMVGIILTYHVRKVEKYRASHFYLVDFLIACVASIVVGIVSHPFFGILIFIILGGYWRVRSILVHSYLLKACPTQNLKATYISMYEFFKSLNSIWVPVALGYAIGRFGAQGGYMYFGISMMIILLGLYMYIFHFSKNNNAKTV